MTDLLKNIDKPADLRLLARADLPGLADELRHCVLDNVSKTGGHLSLIHI
jgi:1-deoxy-D-xylulose-5-phosphate synthase